MAHRTDLEMRAQRDRDTHTRIDGNDFFLLTKFAPKLAAPFEEKPDFFNRMMRYRMRRLARSQFKVGYAAPAKSGQYAYVQTIQGNRVPKGRNTHSLKLAHHYLLLLFSVITPPNVGGNHRRIPNDAAWLFLEY